MTWWFKKRSPDFDPGVLARLNIKPDATPSELTALGNVLGNRFWSRSGWDKLPPELKRHFFVSAERP